MQDWIKTDQLHENDCWVSDNQSEGAGTLQQDNRKQRFYQQPKQNSKYQIKHIIVFSILYMSTYLNNKLVSAQSQQILTNGQNDTEVLFQKRHLQYLSQSQDSHLDDQNNLILAGATGDKNFEHEKALSDEELVKMDNNWIPPSNLKMPQNEEEKQAMKQRFINGEVILKLESIFPRGGPLYGTTKVTVRADGIEDLAEIFPEPKCRFGRFDYVVEGTYIRCTKKPRTFYESIRDEVRDYTCIQCEDSPVYHKAEITTLQVSLTGKFDDVYNSLPYRYYEPTKITGIYPPYGPRDGDTVVQVWGQNFLDLGDDFRCNFGSKSTKAYYISDENLWCRSAKSDVTGKPMPFSVSLNRQQNSLARVSFWYYNEPQLSKLMPDWGPASGGTKVKLSGSGFMPFYYDDIDNRRDTMCDWGPLGKRMANITSSTTAYCESPVSTIMVNQVKLRLTLNNQNVTDQLPFFYFNPPQIVEMSTMRGSEHGGNQIHIYGTRYERNKKIECHFGDIVVPARYVSYTHIVCTAPKSKNGPGYVDLMVKYKNDRFSSAIVRYYYFHAAHISEGPFPNCGPSTGGTQILLKGDSFNEKETGKAKCVFNETYFTNATVINTGALYCNTPELVFDDYGNELMYHVGITLDGENFADDFVVFNFYEELTQTGVSPWLGPMVGGTTITISGTGFTQQNVCELSVRFGPSLLDDKQVSLDNGNIIVQTYASRYPGAVVITISGNNQQFTHDRTLHFRDLYNTFEYYQPFFIVDVSPPSVSNRGVADIRIMGQLFNQFNTKPNQTIWCRFVKMDDDAEYAIPTRTVQMAENELKCEAPMTVSSGFARLQISPNEQNWQDVNQTIQIFQGPRITSVYPRFVVTRNPGNKSVIIEGENFVAKDSRKAKCKFTTNSGDAMIIKAQILSNGSLLCLAPPYTSPEILTVDVTFNGQEYTNDQFKFGYLDPYILSVEPRLVSRNGTTRLKLKGFGMIQMEGAYFDAIYKYDDQMLRCDFGPCKKRCMVPDEHTCYVDTLPQAQMQKHNHSNIGYDSFSIDIRNPDVDYVPDDVELDYGKTGQNPPSKDLSTYYKQVNLDNPISLRTNFSWYDGAQWTAFAESGNYSCKFIPGKTGNVIVLGSAPLEESLKGEFRKRKFLDIWYYKEPNFQNVSSTQVYINEEKEIAIKTDYFWGPDGNHYDAVRRFGKLKCRWTSQSNPNMIKFTDAMMESVPLGSFRKDALPNMMRCKTPRWDHKDTVDLELTINGQEWLSMYTIQFMEDLRLFRISPMSGPIRGNTTVKAWGTGFSVADRPLYLKFGSVAYMEMNRSTLDEESFDNHKYSHEEIHQHPFKLQSAMKGLTILKDGRNLDTNYAQAPDLRKLFKRSRDRMDVWVRNRGGPVKMEVGEILTALVTDQKKSHLDTFKKEVEMDLESSFKDSAKHVQYYYYRQPIIKKVEPLLGLIEGGTPISITGAWFDEKVEYGVFPFCRIGGLLGKAKFFSTTKIVCISPKSTIINETMRIEVSLNGVDFINTRYLFSYYDIPILDDILPKSGPITGGSNIWLKGKRFSKLAEGLKTVKCRFTEIMSDDATDDEISKMKIKYIPAYPIDGETMKCTTPPGFVGGDQAWIDLTFNGADYTANKIKFDFYSIYGSFPKSGPTDAYRGFIQVRGLGFRDNMKIICNMNNTYVLPLAIHWDVIKCPMIVDTQALGSGRRLQIEGETPVPKDRGGHHHRKRYANVGEDDSDEFQSESNFLSVPFAIVIDSYLRKFGEFVYYKQITVDDVMPLLIPNEGRAEVYIQGKGFRTDFKGAKLGCRIGNELGKARIIDSETIKCTIKKQLPLVDEDQSLWVTAALNSYSWADSLFAINIYGITGIYPNAAPWTQNTNIMVTGKGFLNDMSDMGRCKFGAEGSQIIVDGMVLDNEHMICQLPVGFIPFPDGAKTEGIVIPFSIAFQEDIYYPFTEGKWNFRLYKQPRLISATPHEVPAGKINKVFVKADPRHPFFQPPPPPGDDYNNENWIRCKFGYLGSNPAVYVNKTHLLCITPVIHDPADISQDGLDVEVTVAMNGVDYTQQDNDVMIRFLGTDKNSELVPMLYIIVFFGTILFILLFAAIFVFCFGLQKFYVAKSQASEVQSQRSHSMRGSQISQHQNEEDKSQSGSQKIPADPKKETPEVQIEKKDGKMRRWKGSAKDKK